MIVAEILHHASRFYVDNLRDSPNGVTLETSTHQLNQTLRTPYQSVIHMILNPAGLLGRVSGLIPVSAAQVTLGPI
jgi:hypothetical protein